jgi:hypothetical protein
MDNNNYTSSEGYTLEFAILQEDIPADQSTTANFKIPTLINTGTVAKVNTNTSTIRNKTTTNLTSASMNIKDTISLRVPMEYTYYWGTSKIIPAGTRFIVAYIGGNVNEIAIVGRYDRSGADAPACDRCRGICDLCPSCCG